MGRKISHMANKSYQNYIYLFYYKENALVKPRTVTCEVSEFYKIWFQYSCHSLPISASSSIHYTFSTSICHYILVKLLLSVLFNDAVTVKIKWHQ